MDLVIRNSMNPGYIRLSPSNREKFRNANGTIVTVKYRGGFYYHDENGTQMKDVTAAWHADTDNGYTCTTFEL